MSNNKIELAEEEEEFDNPIRLKNKQLQKFLDKKIDEMKKC